LKQAKRRKREVIVRTTCLVASFVVPFLAIQLNARSDESMAMAQGLRLALTSFIIAAAIITLGMVDKKLSSARNDLKTQILTSIFGMILWLVWVGSGQLVFKAVDETNAGNGAFIGH
jgi:hypothetical protein